MGNYKHIVVLTGAGISAASGLPTFRGPSGIWSDPLCEPMSTAAIFESDASGAWRFWGKIKGQIFEAQPNAGHIALADWAKRLASDTTFTVITQNVDRLHQRAGSTNVVELHGTLFRSRCIDSACKLPAFDDNLLHLETVPLCPQCGKVLRPDLTLFNEALPLEAEWLSKKALRCCDLFIAIGTSGSVSPASNFVSAAKYAGAHTVLVNLEPIGSSSQAFDREVLGRAELVLPELVQKFCI